MRGHDLFRYTAILAVALTYVTILLGGNVAASNSGLACSTWPLCQPNTLFPHLTASVAIEWSHRVSAFFLALTIVALTAIGFVYERRRPVLLGLTVAALTATAAQAIMGGVVVLSDLSVWAVVIHLGLATLLFGIVVLLTLLANVREIPPRWIAWARSAATDRDVRDAELARSSPSDGSLRRAG
ncbi:MAG: COX15/CtaA family protein [Thermoplasmata archaeon]